MGSFEELLTDAKDTVNASVRKSRLGSNILHLNRTDRSSVSHKSIEYLHRDHLGSVEAVTNESGNVVRAFGFDPFGERRHEDWNRQLSPSEIDSTADEARTGTTRGYTGHENLDRTGLVHMNGRIYDPQTGRFLSPDPVVQAPGYSQSWNRYSYVMGNPVSFNDPSGYVTAGPLCGAGSLALCANSNDQANGMGTSQFTVAFPTTTITASGYVEVGMETVSAIVSSPAWGAMREGQRPSAAITYYSVPTYTYRYSFTSNTVDNPTQIEIPESGQTDEPMGDTDRSLREVEDAIEGLNRVIEQIDRAEKIADAISFGGTIFDIATGPSGEAIIIGGIAKAGLNKAIKEAFERQLKEHGLRSLRRSHKTISKRLDRHLQKLEEIKKAGGHTSSVEREIRTFTRQLEVLEEMLGK